MNLVLGLLFLISLVAYIASGLGFAFHIGAYIIECDFKSWVQSLSRFGVIVHLLGVVLFFPFVFIGVIVAWCTRVDVIYAFRKYFIKKMYK